MSRDTCRRSTCTNDARGGGGYGGRFCSDECEVKHDHIKADARDAMREPEPEPEPGRRP
jgi:hypothetical protein